MARAPNRARVAAAVLAASVAAALMTGCGVARSGGTVAAKPRSVLPGTAGHPRVHPWPPGGSRTLARSVGRRMLASLVLPPGSRHVGASRTPERAEVIGSNSLADLSSFFVVPMPVQAAAAFLYSHPPAGFVANGTGTSSSRRGVTEHIVSFQLRKTPVGITSDSMLLVSLASSTHGSTMARADAEVVWYPPRTAAEFIRTRLTRKALITASFMNPRPRRFAKVITSRRVIARLAALLNGMRAADNSVMYCPAIDASYHVAFAGRAGQRVVVDPTGCARDEVLVNGKAQPPLWDPGERLIHALHRVLALSPRYR